ncbi:hypothetical protein RHMOL_Rhmol09G0196700 [Rhododendron molle]|uniref:Uncharacterized protein n=1 Tax=Rhododendron molle TaxID=49168 RepID=A0ACC0MGI6_RHOML|nr:hypothetical protein RHMOL_Rhmol09G0196700 [Rhododendron molle]
MNPTFSFPPDWALMRSCDNLRGAISSTDWPSKFWLGVDFKCPTWLFVGHLLTWRFLSHFLSPICLSSNSQIPRRLTPPPARSQRRPKPPKTCSQQPRRTLAISAPSLQPLATVSERWCLWSGFGDVRVEREESDRSHGRIVVEEERLSCHLYWVKKVRFARNLETGDNVAIKILDKQKILKHKMIAYLLLFNEIQVEGLETLDYLDDLQNMEQITKQGDAITFNSENVEQKSEIWDLSVALVFGMYNNHIQDTRHEIPRASTSRSPSVFKHGLSP